jgi:NADH-quinone oxidoreductase subunit N
MVTNMTAFGIVTIVGKSIGSDEISVYAGLSRRSPGLALALLVALLSLGGIPPFGGFVAKLLVFGSAIETNMIWLALIGIINSIIALYYYLSVLKVVYLYRSETESEPLPLSRNWRIAVILCTVSIIAFGTLFTPFVNAAMKAASVLF